MEFSRKAFGDGHYLMSSLVDYKSCGANKYGPNSSDGLSGKKDCFQKPGRECQAWRDLHQPGPNCQPGRRQSDQRLMPAVDLRSLRHIVPNCLKTF